MTDDQQVSKTIIPPTPIPPDGPEVPMQQQRRNDFTVGFGAGLVIFVLAFTGMAALSLLIDVGLWHFFVVMGLAMVLVCTHGFIRRKPLIALGVLAFVGLFVVLLGACLLLALNLRN